MKAIALYVLNVVLVLITLISGHAQNIGIGTTTPHALLQFSNTLSNRKLVLWEAVNNNHQFLGFGINGSVLRYQVDGTASDHVFYAGTSGSTSNELFRIKGNGKIGIGVDPLTRLDIAGTMVGTW